MAGLESQLDKISNAMMGFSAGLQGQLPQFQQIQNQRIQQEAEQRRSAAEQQQKMVAERQKAMYTDANAALQLVKMGNLDGVVQLGVKRLEGLQQLAQQFPDIDPSDTQRVTQLAIAARNGDEEALELLTGELESAVQIGQAIGVLQPPEQEEYTLSPGQARFRGNQQIASVAESAPDGFEILTPEEALSLGLPADKQFQRNKQTQQISQIGSGPAVQVNTGTATESERTAGILANRLDFAQSQINDVLANAPEAESPEALPTALNAVGLEYLARLSNPAERQIIEAAQDDMLDAALTLGTGAAYTKEQLQGYRRSYFPQLGDDQKTIEAKSRRLSNLLDAAYMKAGRGAPSRRRAGGNAAPEVGTVVDGYKFKGGDPAQPSSWEKQ